MAVEVLNRVLSEWDAVRCNSMDTCSDISVLQNVIRREMYQDDFG